MSFSAKNTNREPDTLVAISRALSSLMLYLPLGLLLPLIQALDKMTYYISLKNLTRRYHNLSGVPEKNKYYIPLLMQTYDNAVHATSYILYALFYPAFFVSLKILKIMPLQSSAWLVFGEDIKAHIKKWHKEWFENKIIWLQNNPIKVTYFCVLPIALASVLTAVLGVSILAEIYLFWACSFWSGLMINTLANIVTQGWDSDALKDTQKIVFSINTALSNQDKKRYSKFWGLTGLYLAGDVAFFTGVNRLNEWARGCFASFQYWLSLYVVIKVVANHSPDLILRLESYIDPKIKSDSEQEQQAETQTSILGNGLWLTGYHFLHGLGSQNAINYYHQHQEISHSKDELSVVFLESTQNRNICGA